jgi:hypothetical protein
MHQGGGRSPHQSCLPVPLSLWPSSPDLPSPRLDAVGCRGRPLAVRSCGPRQDRLAGVPGRLPTRPPEGAAAVRLPAPQASAAVVDAVCVGWGFCAGRCIGPGDVDGGAQHGFEGAALPVLPAPQPALSICRQGGQRKRYASQFLA